MPSYEYKCAECGETATLVTRITEQLIIPVCFKCKVEMKRDYRFGSVQFKGSGFYSNERQ